MPSCSKAPRGLFVLSWVTRIFTGTSISPGPSLRQRPDRYTIRAGRNLPDKEFRYLRTVRVTAAVHRGFGSRLITSPLNLPALGRCQPVYLGSRLVHGPVFLLNSRLGLLSAAPHGLQPFRLSPQRAPLLPKLRGQFAEFLNEGSPVRLKVLTPAHLCRSAVRSLRSLQDQLFWAPRARPDCLWVAPPALRRLSVPLRRPTGLDAAAPTLRQACPDASPIPSSLPQRYGNINPLSIAYGYYALGLGPTNPTRIHLPSETLGLRRTRFSRAFSLLIPAFALLVAPARVTPTPSSPQNAPLPSRPSAGRVQPRGRTDPAG